MGSGHRRLVFIFIPEQTSVLGFGVTLLEVQRPNIALIAMIMFSVSLAVCYSEILGVSLFLLGVR